MSLATTDGTTLGSQAHAQPAGAVAAALGVEPALGLGTQEAVRRAVADGPNVIEAAKHEPLWRLVLRASTEPFILLLAVAGGLAIAVGEVRDGLLVLAGLLPIVGADVVTEFGANGRSRHSGTQPPRWPECVAMGEPRSSRRPTL